MANLKAAVPNLKRGSLVVWGDIFGGRIDNIHSVVDVAVIEEGCVQIVFNLGERLTIWSPDGLTANDQEFRIDRASRVRWEWYYYGREQLPENLYCIEHWITGDDVGAKSNEDWFTPSFSPSASRPAVELL